MVRQPESGTNYTYLTDFIEVRLSIQLLNNGQIKDFYLKDRLSAPQIAKKLGVARSVVTCRLNAMGIHPLSGAGRLTDPTNYLCRTAPYGYSVKKGQLVINKAEVQICRLVVQLIDREGFSQSAVARELGLRKLKNRAGNSKWDSKTIFNIYKRWKQKV